MPTSEIVAPFNSFDRIVMMFLLLSLPGLLLAQQASTKSPGLEERREKWFDSILGVRNIGIVNGPEYFMPFQSIASHPFFESREAGLGHLEYDGQWYYDKPFFYDCYSDLVVLKLEQQDNFYSLVQLDTARIDEFWIFGHHFRKYRPHLKKWITGSLSGYYDVIAEENTISLVARRSKIKGIDASRRLQYENADQFFFVLGNRWTPFSGKRTALSLVNNKDELRNFLKSNHINLSKGYEEDIVKVTKFLGSHPELLIKS